MIHLHGLYWPDDVGMKWRHSLKHVKSLEPTLRLCKQHRTAVQAGGNVGLWPRRMADVFARVVTFEPEEVSLECLRQNVPANVSVCGMALGDTVGKCGIDRRSLGSHRVTYGSAVPVTTVDSLGLDDVDLLQLDIEGYEWHALKGAADTVRLCRPVIHLELRGFTEHYGQTDASVRELLEDWGYREHSQAPGNDVVFIWRAH